ncbi:hypothetical protein BZB76_1043 [Actinomadura pelletieri DSM 43383]|uniref:Uncharacterized protein n=1 Tax=Actinomadura pelletieri DSM 43383 TaxID=1120940 RepID=A0A495QZC3_9ACTN|nr:hypothetical protein [Actinomadura pelletieri]RKS79571.1 hypothetical protein BZB76_1043 [Actinomadura pelletieri DSM 43383]
MNARDFELQLLNDLRTTLLGLGLAAQLDENMPGLWLRTANPDLYVWVFVGASGRTFTWRRADSKHPVDDLPGAAAKVARFVTAQGGQLNGLADGHFD